MSVVKNNIKIGYALGGGAARGLSHIGASKFFMNMVFLQISS